MATLVNPGKSIKVRLTTAQTNREIELENTRNMIGKLQITIQLLVSFNDI